ncbi:MAG: ion channel, partial [Candidatus Igneacidithiobacillus chanchocoensis]
AILATAVGMLLFVVSHFMAMPWPWFALDLLIFLILLRLGQHFTRRSVIFSAIFVLALLLLVLSYSTVGALFLSSGFSPEIHDPVSALYFSVVTISTVGYGSIVPKTAEARIFTISVILLGITVFSTAFSSILVPLIGQHLHSIIGKHHPTLPKNHIVIAGAGDLARNTYHALCTRYYKVVLVGRDWKPELADEAEIHPHHYITGDSSRTMVLEKAYLRNAYAILCLDASDDLNAFTLLAARQIKPDIRTVLLMNEVSHAKTLFGLQPDLVIELQAVMAAWMVQGLLGEPLQDPLSSLLFFLSDDHSV